MTRRPKPAPAPPLSTPASTFWVLLGLETVLRWIARATGDQVDLTIWSVGDDTSALAWARLALQAAVVVAIVWWVVHTVRTRRARRRSSP
ncbi:hypothetical protein [Aeromicrobium sp. CnD17-E]|uniref:hypothetical protein n=1 Tax=Aeromicrobium sp. CnD17-E TaxID=2954487 RepID=UPI002096A4E8|nr:hypothetical protein [Aeromicrobium sp. CnD17-E]MCO7237679.1 hypothetical protein [Aeromicrobium sp. CnD17-E]